MPVLSGKGTALHPSNQGYLSPPPRPVPCRAAWPPYLSLHFFNLSSGNALQNTVHI